MLFAAQTLSLRSQTSTSGVVSEDWFSWSKEQIAQKEEQGLFEENLLIFREGHSKGYFYFLHPALPGLKPYLDFPGFEELVERDRILYDSALRRSTTLYQVQLPEGFHGEVSYPLFFVFHGGNSNFKRLQGHWNHACLDKNWIKVYLQSYRHFDSGSYTWRSGDPRSDYDLKQIFRELQDDYPVDTSQIVLAGISAGANYAMGMALRGILPVKGLIAFCPGLPGVFRSVFDAEVLNTGIRMYMVGGEHDFYLEQQKSLMEHLDGLGIHYSYVQVKGMGHRYPDDEGKYLQDGLQFLMEE